MSILIETIGWIGAILILGSYGLNISGKLASSTKLYIWANLIGGLCFLINTYIHKAYPSVAVNGIWILFAINSLLKLRKAKE